MRNRLPYNTPEGYMESLDERLLGIPEREGVPGWWTLHRGTVTPFLTFAASLLILILAGNFFQPRNSGQTQNPTEEEIVEYLIDSGTSVYLLSENI